MEIGSNSGFCVYAMKGKEAKEKNYESFAPW